MRDFSSKMPKFSGKAEMQSFPFQSLRSKAQNTWLTFREVFKQRSKGRPIFVRSAAEAK